MQLVLVNNTNRPIINKMIRFDSTLPDKQVVEEKIVADLAEAKVEAGADWEAGKAIYIQTRPLEQGDLLVLSNGKIAIITAKNSSIVFDSNEYTGTVPNITIDKSVLDAIVYKPNQTQIDSVIDGDLTIWQ